MHLTDYRKKRIAVSSMPVNSGDNKAVISQSMYFPWVGLLEQVRLADFFVHYDDVQLTRGFYNRVQVKTGNGSGWITVPLRDHHRGQKINEALIDDRQDWRGRHRDILNHAYRGAPFCDEMLSLVDRVFSSPVVTLADISRASIMALVDYFKIGRDKQFIDSANLGIEGSGSRRLHDICRRLGARVYLTGHGALNYLDHELFESSGITVRYMDYQRMPYPQLHGEFTPYVSALDLIANLGPEGARCIRSETVYWREYIKNG